MSDQVNKYFSIKGSEKEGWTLMMYSYVKDKDGNETDAVTSAWAEPKAFDNLRDTLAELCAHEDLAGD